MDGRNGWGSDGFSRLGGLKVRLSARGGGTNEGGEKKRLKASQEEVQCGTRKP